MPSTSVMIFPEADDTRSPGIMIPDKIQRIGCTQRDGFAGNRKPGSGAQRLHRDRQPELLAKKSAHKSSAANLPLIFEPPQGDQQFPPARHDRLPRNHFAEHHAVTPQQHPASGLSHARAIGSFAREEQRPATDAVTRPRTVPAALPRAPLRINAARGYCRSRRR